MELRNTKGYTRPLQHEEIQPRLVRDRCAAKLSSAASQLPFGTVARVSIAAKPLSCAPCEGIGFWGRTLSNRKPYLDFILPTPTKTCVDACSGPSRLYGDAEVADYQRRTTAWLAQMQGVGCVWNERATKSPSPGGAARKPNEQTQRETLLPRFPGTAFC